MRSDWQTHKEDIERMVARGWTDATIGDYYGVIGCTIQSARKKLGIKRTRGTKTPTIPQPESQRLAPIHTYKTKEGYIVKVYPTLYAEGAYISRRVR